MQMREIWVARWAGKDRFAGDYQEFHTFEEAQEYMRVETDARKLLGESYDMEVVRVTEVQFAFTQGTGKR